jgi:uncharacterized Ntn-hydrolase superfamily protein
MQRGTFSIVARDKRSGDYGVASTTAAPCVGAFLPFAQEGVGAIATQAWVNVNLGFQGLVLMRQGLPVKSAIETLLSLDEGRAKRQVIGIDADSCYGFTGDECSDSKGHILGDDFAVAGNILVSERVLEAMAEAFKKSKGELAHRLMRVLTAGQEVGGDKRGKMSATLLVASSKPRLYHNLRVDCHDHPLNELRRIFGICEQMQEEYGDDDDGEVLRYHVTTVRR